MSRRREIFIMDLYYEYLNAYGYDSDEDEDCYFRETIGVSKYCRKINVHLPNGFMNTKRYVFKITRTTRFNEYDLHAYVKDRNEDYCIDNYCARNTYFIDLRCVCRIKQPFSEHHRQGYIHTFTNVEYGDKGMIIRAPRFLMYIIEQYSKQLKNNMTCDEIKNYMLWQGDVLIEDSCYLYRICDDRLILHLVVTY